MGIPEQRGKDVKGFSTGIHAHPALFNNGTTVCSHSARPRPPPRSRL